MKKKIMKKTFLLSLLAFFTSIPTFADVAINATNFPDPIFRDYVKTKIMGNANATTLTTAKINSTYKINVSNKGISSLKGIEYFTEVVDLIASGNNLTTLDVSNLSKLRWLNLTNNNIASIDLSHNTELRLLWINIKKLSLNKNTELLSLSIWGSELTSLDLSNNNKLEHLYLEGNPNLVSLTLPTDPLALKAIRVLNCPLLNSLDVSRYTNLETLQYTGNGFKYVDVSDKAELLWLDCHDNGLTSIDVSNNPKLKVLDCYNNLLTSLDLSNNPSLKGLRCQNNLITELNLSQHPNLRTGSKTEDGTEIESHFNCTLLEFRNYTGGNFPLTDYIVISYTVDVIQIGVTGMFNEVFDPLSVEVTLSPQNLRKDYVAIDGRSKLGVQCNTNSGVLANYGNCTMTTFDGNNYIVVADEVRGKTDVHAPNSSVSYNYNTGYTGTYDAAKTMEVNIGTSAHGMYIHPETLRGSDNFYSGTLYLEFPARIPEGVQCYYAKGLDANEDLVGLTEVTGTIPANTAVIVKTPSEYKFFAFNESDETPTAPTDNIIEGTIEGLSVTPGTVLTLGHNVDRSTGEYDNFGFWNYRGNQISPFRAYIPKANLSAGAKNGFSLLFPEDGTTGIARMANSDAAEEGAWYTLSGTRISGKPTTKGIYVNKGQKVVIR